MYIYITIYTYIQQKLNNVWLPSDAHGPGVTFLRQLPIKPWLSTGLSENVSNISTGM